MTCICKVQTFKSILCTLQVLGADNFEELYKHFDKISLGYAEDEIADPKDMEQYYPQDKQEKYGVLGIEII